MKHCARFIWVLFLLLPLGGAWGQGSLHPAGNPPFTQQELDQMLAPIALYPDPLLAQVLMASTYPLEVVEAARWSRNNPGLTGDAAVRAVAGEDWDASVKSLVAFPQVLQTMDAKISWTERLGDAFLAQQAQVMDTVQTLRRRAQRAGNLQSNAQVVIWQEGDDITIEPGNPSVIYVPYYDPRVVYGAWWWPLYPPIYWSPWYGYYWHGGIAWGVSFGVGLNFFYGGWNWPHHRLYYNGRGRWYGPVRSPVGRPWGHDPRHRLGVPYRNPALDRRFDRARFPARNAFEPYRGRMVGSPPPRFYPRHGTGGPPGGARIQERGGAFDNVGHGPDTRINRARGGASMGAPHRGVHDQDGRRHGH